MGQKKVMMLTRIFQSTPSAWRETDRFNGFFLGIPVFQSTPSAWRETGICSHASAMLSFQSTPSAWRETKSAWDFSSSLAISIHSLRMEGDRNTSAAVRSAQYFNPLPPHGGRHHLTVQGTDFRHFNPLPPHGGRLKPFEFHARQSAFQSTPSAWRKTLCSCTYSFIVRNFNPLPPHGGRLYILDECKLTERISIHSLRMEGDAKILFHVKRFLIFQSTPSAWRETFRGADDISGNLFQSTPSAWRETQGKRFCA